MDCPGPVSDSPISLSATAGEEVDPQALREWFHLPRFNQCDGLDDYDGNYRGFDPLEEVVTAHLRNRIRRLSENPPDEPVPAAGPRPDAQMPATAAENPNRRRAAAQQVLREPRAEDSDDESLGWLSGMLTGIRAAACSGAKEVCAVFCDAPLSAESLELLAEHLPGAVLVLADRRPDVPGLAAWLGALAMGACRVALVGREDSPARQEQLRLTRTILAGLHLDPGERLLILAGGAPDGRAGPSPAPVPLAPAAWEPAGSERDLLWQALEHLHNQAPAAPDQTLLDPGAPFGAVGLDASRCTLCMACVGACPTRALRHGSAGPQIRFRERDCTQCGRCRQICPEQAVTLTPRICYDSRLTGSARILHQEAPLRCSVCGAPFATAGIVAAVTRRLAAHWMYQDPAARQRLTMCRDCRIRNYFASPQPPPPEGPAGGKHEPAQPSH